MRFPVISADSHITEPPNTYIDYIDAAWRDRGPRWSTAARTWATSS